MSMESNIQNIDVDLIIPNRFQPRLTFDEDALNELAKSIKEHGIIQPLVLRKVNDKYEIIAGERRYKASILAGLTHVPAIITNLNDNESAEVAIVENVQRKNLNSMEEAKSYKKLLDKGYLTQDALAKKMGISQSTLANKLRLLNLAPEVQKALLNNQISERHARSLLVIDDKLRQVNLLNRIISERLTVRQLDEIIKNINKDIQERPTNENVIEPQKETTSGVDLIDELSINKAEIEKENQLESTNIFDKPFTEYETNTFDKPNTVIETPVEATNVPEKVESLDMSNDGLDNKEEQKIFNNPFFNVLPSLEDEVTNMNTGDSNDYFNPFNNEIDTDEQEIKEEKKEDLEPIKQKELIKKGDLSSVKTAYDDLKEKVENAGFKIVSEDFDFEDIYQIIIKIEKQG